MIYLSIPLIHLSIPPVHSPIIYLSIHLSIHLLGFTWGDPHFETLDGHNYTFNGLGEFSLLQSTTHNLTVQIRLSKLDETSATVIKAVAIKSHDSQLVQIEINQLNLYVLYIGNSEYKQIPTDGEYLVVTEDNIYNDNQLSSVDSTSINNVILLNKNDTMIITTSSGAALTIGKEMDFLYLGVELSTRFFNSTEGLLGYFDEDPSNDFQLPNGTVLSNTLTEEELYSTFGLQCKWMGVCVCVCVSCEGWVMVMNTSYEVVSRL